jgi:3-dehydroquinate dehydratase type I
MEVSTPGTGGSEHASKRRMIASSGSAPASPRDSPRQIAEQAFEASFIRPEKQSSSSHISKSTTPLRSQTPSGRVRNFHPDASLVLVGIRGCGKRSLGFIAATALGRRFVTEDHFFLAATGISRQDYLKIHGSQEFHQKDIEISRRMLDENRTHCVIECGLGSLTTSVQEYLRKYCQTNPVVHLLRDINDIKQLLQLSDQSARMLEIGDLTHRRCSNFEYFNFEDSSTKEPTEIGAADRLSPAYSFKLKEAKEDFSFFARFVTGATRPRPDDDSPFSLSEIPVDRRLYSHALEVKLSWYLGGEVDFSLLESGGDVVEIVVDQWSMKAMASLNRMVAEIRRRMAVPVVLSAQIGTPGISRNDCVKVLEHGLRLSVEYLSVDLELDIPAIMLLVSSKGHTRIIGSFRDMSSNPDGWENDSWLTMYNKAERLRCDIVRLLRVATSHEDNEMLSRFTNKIRGRPGLSPPLIAYNTGPLGRTSQIFNQILTSVTHPALEHVAGQEQEHDRQISSRDAVQALFRSFALENLKFYILGGSVSYSLSPAMHNSAYQLLGMDHVYATKDITSLDELDVMAKDPHLGGVAVVQPFKILALKHLTSKSRHAEVIGAANTLLPLRSGPDGKVASLPIQANQRNRTGRIVGWHGENTDFIGITSILTRSLSPRNVIQAKTTGLIIGAGGMARAACYAMLKIGCQNVFVYNRTTSNAEALAAQFNTWTSSRSAETSPAQVRVIKTMEEPWPAKYAMPTMIVSCVNEETTQTKTAANFGVPQQWLKSPTGGVIIEMAYNNPNTRLIQQIRQLQKESEIPWVLVTGIEVLPEQAVAQFELMTGRKAPRSVMRQATGVGQSKPT